MSPRGAGRTAGAVAITATVIVRRANCGPVCGPDCSRMIVATRAVPILMQIFSLARPHINTHAMDEQEAIRLEAMRQLVELRQKTSPEEFADAMMAMDAGRIVDLPSPPKAKK